MCPVVEMCTTRGELNRTAKTTLRKKREIQYVLNCRDGEVFLVRRPRDAALMRGMWELPEIPAGAHAASGKPIPGSARNDKMNKSGCGDSERLFTIRHSITVTDYTVQVWRGAAPDRTGGTWFAVDRLRRVALTGLARKVLRRAKII